LIRQQARKKEACRLPFLFATPANMAVWQHFQPIKMPALKSKADFALMVDGP